MKNLLNNPYMKHLLFIFTVIAIVSACKKDGPPQPKETIIPSSVKPNEEWVGTFIGKRIPTDSIQYVDSLGIADTVVFIINAEKELQVDNRVYFMGKFNPRNTFKDTMQIFSFASRNIPFRGEVELYMLTRWAFPTFIKYANDDSLQVHFGLVDKNNDIQEKVVNITGKYKRLIE
jgi:hypothetical protein